MGIDLQERGAIDALDASYSSLFSELSGAFRARGLTSEEARDLAQESLVRTFVHLKRHGQTRPDLRPLAHTIAKRLYVERGRRPRPQFVDLPQAENVADPAPQPADAIVAMEEQRDVQAALRSLAPRHRRVISLWMSGMRPAEIAQELGIKRNAADALLHRARRQLATKLDPTRTALGIFGLFALRLRSSVRRLVDAVASFDPSGSVTQAGTGLATAAIAALLLVATPASGSASKVDAHRGRSAEAVTDVAAAAGTGEKASSAKIAVPPPVREVTYPVTVGPRFRNPTTGEEDELALDVIYLPEREGNDVLDPVLEPTVRLTCGAAPGACSGGR